MRNVAGVDELTRVALAAKRDPRQREVLVETAYPQVRRLCARLVDRESSDDLAQETFLQAIRALGRFRADASARSWMLAIARHVCLEELRCRGRRRQRDAMLATFARGRSMTMSDASQESTVA
ncbi:MAG: sigma-70 family RNA polymerase sigma factor, partial [Acidimicrobiales bacterium]